jgi:hypothetical protein
VKKYALITAHLAGILGIGSLILRIIFLIQTFDLTGSGVVSAGFLALFGLLLLVAVEELIQSLRRIMAREPLSR